MTYIPDNYDAFCQHEAEQQAKLDKLPICCECGEPIQTEDCYEVNDELYCPDCMDNHRAWVESLIENKKGI